MGDVRPFLPEEKQELESTDRALGCGLSGQMLAWVLLMAGTPCSLTFPASSSCFPVSVFWNLLTLSPCPRLSHHITLLWHDSLVVRQKRSGGRGHGLISQPHL